MAFDEEHAAYRSGVENGSSLAEVIVVADHSVNRIVLTRSAERYGWRVSESDHAGCVGHLKRIQPKLVLVDCPDDISLCSGLFSHISESAADARPKVILVVDAAFDYPAPVNIVLRKPVTADKIEAAFATVLPR